MFSYLGQLLTILILIQPYLGVNAPLGPEEANSHKIDRTVASLRARNETKLEKKEFHQSSFKKCLSKYAKNSVMPGLK